MNKTYSASMTLNGNAVSSRSNTKKQKDLYRNTRTGSSLYDQPLFNLATAQTSLEIANYNFAYADTLYRYAQGRYNIGTITENEMLQLELNKLTEQTNCLNAQIEVDDYIQSLRSYLGISENINLVVIPDDSIPHFTVDVNEAMQLAFQNNPDISAFERRRLQSESNVAEAKANRGFKAALYAQFGLTQSNEKLKESYRDPMDQQLVTLGIRIPILDWGVGKGRVKVAKSNRDKVYTELEQERMDFELNVAKIVKQFNIQAGKVAIAYKTDQTAQRRNDVARRLYLLGKSTILDLNAAIAEKTILAVLTSRLYIIIGISITVSAA